MGLGTHALKKQTNKQTKKLTNGKEKKKKILKKISTYFLKTPPPALSLISKMPDLNLNLYFQYLYLQNWK